MSLPSCAGSLGGQGRKRGEANGEVPGRSRRPAGADLAYKRWRLSSLEQLCCATLVPHRIRTFESLQLPRSRDPSCSSERTNGLSQQTCFSVRPDKSHDLNIVLIST